jgi:DNA-binding transcriptional LysR family regulator
MLLTSAAILLNRVLDRCSIRHVQVLLMLAETGSVQCAAQAIGVSRSSLEHALSELEELLDTELFRYDGSGLQPTPACAALLPHARQVMLGVAAGADALEAHHRRGRIFVRVLATSAAAGGLLANALPAFEACYARVHVQWREDNGADHARAIARGEVDLVAGRRPPILPKGWEFRELLTDRFAAVCAPDHPLAGRAQASWGELARRAWLLPPAGSAAREHFDALMAHTGNVPLSYCVVPNWDDMADWLMRDHEMLAFAPVAALLHLLVGGELVPLHPEVPAHESIGLLQPRCASEAALQLAGFLQHFAASPCGAAAPHQRAQFADQTY